MFSVEWEMKFPELIWTQPYWRILENIKNAERSPRAFSAENISSLAYALISTRGYIKLNILLMIESFLSIKMLI